MASLANQVSFFFLLVLFLSPQIQARQNKFFSFFTHFKTTHNVEDPQLPQSPSPAPAPAQEPASAPAQEPAAAPEIVSTTLPSGPAPEPQFLVETGNGYGLYGVDSNQYSPTKETPKTTLTDFEDELLNEDFNDNKLLNEDFNDNKSYKKGYPQTNFHNNNEVYTKNYNNEENKNNYNSYNNGKEFYNNNNNNYERRGEGMSDTRFMENGKYYYNVNSENEKYNNVNGYKSERGSTENEGNYEKNQYQNEFETMEEYEKQQEAQGYTYTP